MYAIRSYYAGAPGPGRGGARLQTTDPVGGPVPSWTTVDAQYSYVFSGLIGDGSYNFV